MRNTFLEELIIAAETNENIVLVIGDLGFGVVEAFAKRFPDRFFNAGVAEQNMMGMCAGLASEGFHVFAYSIANFPTFRCAEQLRNDVDYHCLPVTTVSVGGGLAYGNLGYSHHAVQDYALLRTMPNMLIAAPGDPLETRACVRYLVENPQPSYLRLGKTGEPCYHNEIPRVEPGRWLTVREGEGVKKTILSTGTALDLAQNLVVDKDEYSDYTIHSMPLWGMNFKPQQINQVDLYQEVVAMEDHLIDGGFGSWLLESLVESKELVSRVRLKGLPASVCGMVGKQSALLERSGLK